MGILDRLKTFALTSSPVQTAMRRMGASSGGSLYSEQAVSQYNQFFDDLMRIETDEVLLKAGVQRHNLSILLGDDEIVEKVDRRIEALTQSGYTLSPSEGSDALFIYDQLNKHLETLLMASMNAKLYGYSVTEIIWDKATYDATGKFVPLKLSEKPMQWFEPKNDGRLLYFAEDWSQPQEVDTKVKYILQRHRATYAAPKGVAILTPVYWLWFFKKNGWTFWSKFLERFGSPLLVGTTEGDTKEMASALAAAHNQSIFTMPDGDSVAAISAAGSGESFKAYDEAINRRLAKYLLGQTLTSGTDRGGTAGQGQIHERQQDIIFQSDKNFALKYIRDFINLLCELNGIAEAPWFNFKIEKGAQNELAERDTKLVAQGLEFNKEYYIDTYDIDAKYVDGVRSLDNGQMNQLPTSSKPKVAMQLKAATFDSQQQELEQITTNLAKQDMQPMDSAAILAVIKTATSEDDLREKILAMVGQDLADSDFTAFMETALVVADIHGFADEANGD